MCDWQPFIEHFIRDIGYSVFYFPSLEADIIVKDKRFSYENFVVVSEKDMDKCFTLEIVIRGTCDDNWFYCEEIELFEV